MYLYASMIEVLASFGEKTNKQTNKKKQASKQTNKMK